MPRLDLRDAVRKPGRWLRSPDAAARASRNGIWSTIETAVPMLSTALFLMMLARVLSASDFGVYAYATTMAGFGVAAVTAGLNGLAVRELVTRPDEQGSILSDLMLLRVVFAALASVVLVAIALTAGEDALTMATFFAALVVFGRAIDAPTFWFQAVTRTRITASVRTVVSLLALAARAAVAFLAPSLAAFLALLAAEALVTSVVILIRYRAAPQAPRFARPSAARALALLRRSWPLMASAVADQLNSRADILIIQALLGSGPLGIYAAATRLGEFSYFLPRSYATGTFPALLAVRDRFGARSAEYRAALQRSLDSTFWMGVLVTVPLFLLSDWLVALMFGAQFAAAGPVLAVYSLSTPFVFLGAAASKWIIAEGKFHASLWRHLGGALINIVLNLLLVPQYGLIAAAWVAVFSYAFAGCFSFLLTPSTWRYGFQMILAILAPVRMVFRFAARLIDRPAEQPPTTPEGNDK